MHEKLALKFAARLSPAFELRVYDRIHELLTTGSTRLPNNHNGDIIQSLQSIIDQLHTHDTRLSSLQENICEIEAISGDFPLSEFR